MADLSSKPTLTGRLVSLRPVTGDDTEHFLRILADPEVVRLTGSANHSGPAEGLPRDKAREWYSTRVDQSDRLDLAVVDNQSGEVVGEVALNNWNPGSRSIS